VEEVIAMGQEILCKCGWQKEEVEVDLCNACIEDNYPELRD
jgi:hypothetical protein